MRTLVRVVRDIDDRPAVIRDLAQAHNPSAGVIVIRPTPGRGDSGIARDILRALGKRFDIPRTPRSAARLLAPTRLWLKAERIRYLIVVRAHLLAPADWTALRTLAAASVNEICLVIHAPHVSDAHHATLRGAFSTTTDPEHLPGYLSDRAPTQTVAQDRGPHPPVPRASFPAFLTRCTELLEHDDLRCVAQTYEDGQKATERWLKHRDRATPVELHTFLWHLTNVDSVDRALALLRGAQSRLLLAGLLLQVDTGRFVAWHDAAPRATLNAPISQLLRTFISMQTAALAALATLMRAGPERLAKLNVGDINDDVSELRGGHLIPDHARALVRAQLLARAARSDDAPLFTGHDGAERASTRILAAQLEVVAERTGLQFVSSKSGPTPADHVEPWATVTAFTDVRR